MALRQTSVVACTLLTATIFFAADIPLQPLQQLAQQSKDLLPPPNAGLKKPAWKSSLALGLSLARGNKDALLLNGNFQTQRKSAVNELLFGLDGAYGEDSGTKNYEQLHVYSQFNHYFTRRFYNFLRVDGLHDGIKNIDYRLTVSPGVGYFLLPQTNLTLAVEVGPSFVLDRQGGHEETYAAARLAERLEYKFNPTTRLWENVEVIPQLNRSENFIINAEVGVETSVTKELGLRVYLQDSFVNQPAAGYKNNDLRLISGVSYKF